PSAAPAAAALGVRDVFARPLIEGDRPAPFLPSPDGRHVAFVWNPRGERSPRDLWVVDVPPAGPPRQLTHFVDPTPEAPQSAGPVKRKRGAGPRRLSVDEMDWGPRSDFVVVTAGGDLWSVPLAGDPVRLTDTDAVEAQPKVAPDGKSVLYESGGDLFRLALV